MKKIFFAALIAALVVTMYVTPAFAMEVETETETETVVETETEAATETEVETELETETATETEMETEVETETETETVAETEAVDGAIVENDYLAKMLEGANQWLKDNPTMVGSTACSGLTMAAAIIMAKVSKKEREAGKEREKKQSQMTSTLNNNAVEIMETTKSFMKEGKDTISQSVDTMMGGFKGIGDEIVEELRANRRETRANRRETRANSILLAELLKDARLPAKRKEEILTMYYKELGEEADVDDEIDEA